MHFGQSKRGVRWIVLALAALSAIFVLYRGGAALPAPLRSLFRTSSGAAASKKGGKGPSRRAGAASTGSHASLALENVVRLHPRAACKQRNPASLRLSAAQRAYLAGENWYIAVTLRNNDQLLDHFLHELLVVVHTLMGGDITVAGAGEAAAGDASSAAPSRPGRVYVSIFESNSNDATPVHLSGLADLLVAAGVPHTILHTRSLAQARREGRLDTLLAGKPLGGRRLQESGDEEGASAPPVNLEEEGYEGAGAELEEEGLELVRVEAHPPPASGGGGRRLEADPRPSIVPRAPDDVAAMDSILFSGGDAAGTTPKWSGNRVAFLSRVRNWVMKPLYDNAAGNGTSRASVNGAFTRVLFLNDVLYCAEDMVRLALHTASADAACGLDFDTNTNYKAGFYDHWVARDVHGREWTKGQPFVHRVADTSAVRAGRPFPVYCCWNGAVAAVARPFYSGVPEDIHRGSPVGPVRFRRGRPGECAASECSLFCKDYWSAGARKFVVDPHVRLAYSPDTWGFTATTGEGVEWLAPAAKEEEATGGTGMWPLSGGAEGVFDWPRHPPGRVACCGLEGNGREPDAGCINEPLVLPGLKEHLNAIGVTEMPNKL